MMSAPLWRCAVKRWQSLSDDTYGNRADYPVRSTHGFVAAISSTVFMQGQLTLTTQVYI